MDAEGTEKTSKIQIVMIKQKPLKLYLLAYSIPFNCQVMIQTTEIKGDNPAYDSSFLKGRYFAQIKCQYFDTKCE